MQFGDAASVVAKRSKFQARWSLARLCSVWCWRPALPRLPSLGLCSRDLISQLPGNYHAYSKLGHLGAHQRANGDNDRVILQNTAEEQSPHKERILKAASDVFLTIGFEKTSTAEIARRAKVSKRELYLHFSGKRALLAAVVHDLQSDMQDRMDSLWAAELSLGEVLLNSAKVIQGFILSERFGKLVRIVAAESYHSPTIAKQFFDLGPKAGRAATARFLKEQMKQGNLRRADPWRAADDFLDLVVGAQLMTAVILGQIKPIAPRRANTRHAVEVFLMIYSPNRSKLTVKPRSRATR